MGGGLDEQGDDSRVKRVLDDTVALVTGASSGIGAATAAALAAQGAAVALAARRGDRLEALAAGIRDHGGAALVLECDITDERQAVGAVERTVAELGPPGHTHQQRRGDAARPGDRRAPAGVAADGAAQRARPALLRACRIAPSAARRRGRPAPGRRHGEHQLGGGPGGPQRQRCLLADQVSASARSASRCARR